eukprot:CAMPEP_0197722604 /NCGR_PEP_ID=MMETSP1434-20131217/5232_1 /TAXON_ID=265543 /ORGANISM="Minutocellus polymorphus, Strain CCMP3303" /LENGTH=54 /DNA_ID=CAMNT_0043307773 /DNA_START=396 /DNA_END=560 /DNA_ORIENTATION=+
MSATTSTCIVGSGMKSFVEFLKVADGILQRQFLAANMERIKQDAEICDPRGARP